MKTAIGVMLSGNATVYGYAIDEKDLVNRNVGDRVVIANKTKDGGELSMSIGTYVGPLGLVAPDLLKPVVQFIDADRLLAAKVETLRLEAK